MSYTDLIGRITSLDSLMKSVDPQWELRGMSLANDMAASMSGASSFAGILDDASAEGTDGTTTASSRPNVLLANTAGSLDMYTPLPGGKLTQAFGPSTETLEPSATVAGVKYAHYHNGIDLAASLGSTVRAAADGTVTYAGRQSDGAVVVKIQHSDGYTSMYAHLDPSLSVSVGQTVSVGQAIGQVGMTGNTTGPHLHFSLFGVDGRAVDPSSYIAAGRLPDSTSLLSPLASDSGMLSQESASAVLARFDRVASQIPYAAEIRQAAVANGIDPLLLAGLVWNESNFHNSAVSRAGATGLTQLMPGTARELGVTDINDPAQNLNGGARYLAIQLRRFGRVDEALAAYNAGPTRVAESGGVPDTKHRYVARILNKWSSYQELAS